ncbi:helix-turn-helix transcriptional regulator [Longibaculum muris]|uniref:helix-turn-helix transcriptional regulator n=1 Tax=Longibaculum muris TaxID=1796628 RepID=UPI0022DFC484|nr:helix-turn-helix transcriptional regulator [Longibaculum muris]
MSTLSENIKKYRESKNMTQDELGELLLVSGKTISSWEKGRSEPKIDMIEKLGKIFDCSSARLLGEEEQDFFTSPQDALEFILKQEMFAQFGGYNLDTMSDDEIIDMANDIAQFIKMIAKRHR